MYVSLFSYESQDEHDDKQNHFISFIHITTKHQYNHCVKTVQYIDG